MYPCTHKVCPMLDIGLVYLTRGMYAIVDKADYTELSKYKWSSVSTKGGSRPVRGKWNTLRKNNDIIYMYRQLVNAVKGDGLSVDHINHNTLDNRRSNLRVCTHKQNIRNQRPQTNCSSKYKGVSWCKFINKWRATIHKDKKGHSLGTFDNEKDAARKYNEVAREFFGDFASINII